MKKRNDLRPLTKAEMEVMNVLWDATEALTIHEIIERYPEPRPAYTTIATFLKIIEGALQKGGNETLLHLFSCFHTREIYHKCNGRCKGRALRKFHQETFLFPHPYRGHHG